MGRLLDRAAEMQRRPFGTNTALSDGTQYGAGGGAGSQFRRQEQAYGRALRLLNRRARRGDPNSALAAIRVGQEAMDSGYDVGGIRNKTQADAGIMGRVEDMNRRNTDLRAADMVNRRNDLEQIAPERETLTEGATPGAGRGTPIGRRAETPGLLDRRTQQGGGSTLTTGQTKDGWVDVTPGGQTKDGWVDVTSGGQDVTQIAPVEGEGIATVETPGIDSVRPSGLLDRAERRRAIGDSDGTISMKPVNPDEKAAYEAKHFLDTDVGKIAKAIDNLGPGFSKEQKSKMLKEMLTKLTPEERAASVKQGQKAGEDYGEKSDKVIARARGQIGDMKTTLQGIIDSDHSPLRVALAKRMRGGEIVPEGVQKEMANNESLASPEYSPLTIPSGNPLIDDALKPETAERAGLPRPAPTPTPTPTPPSRILDRAGRKNQRVYSAGTTMDDPAAKVRRSDAEAKARRDAANERAKKSRESQSSGIFPYDSVLGKAWRWLQADNL